MQLVSAVIRHFKLEAVMEALKEIGVTGLTTREARGFGRQGGHSEVYRGAEYKMDLLPKLEVCVVVDDGQLDDVIHAISDAAITGRIGDGKIWVTKVEQMVRIRTGERGPAAI